MSCDHCLRIFIQKSVMMDVRRKLYILSFVNQMDRLMNGLMDSLMNGLMDGHRDGLMESMMP